MKNPLHLIAPLFLLTFVAMQAHELTHQLAGRLVCGCWGTMTFNRFYLPPVCQQTLVWLWSTAAGPSLSYLLMWIGAAMVLRSPRFRVAGAVLVFANLPLARFVTFITGHGDEMVIARILGGTPLMVAVGVLCCALVIPPVVIASRIFERKRIAWTFGALAAPMIFDAALKLPLLEPMLKRMSFAPIAGIPPAVLIADGVALLLAAALLVRMRTAAPARN
ncbi:MAG: hypothetical protein JWO97_2843 [Acidobacteria bacterium]|nr:hypothetical protein [Acidobacteriota bacterium]